jgi:uncharacterized protein
MALVDDARTGYLHIEVCYSPAPEEVMRFPLTLPSGSTLAQALEASGLLLQHPEIGQIPKVGIWGRVQSLETVLRDRDRVEVYRPLAVDPKEARRLRHSMHRRRG